jgi:hypothetical protein
MQFLLGDVAVISIKQLCIIQESILHIEEELFP